MIQTDDMQVNGATTLERCPVCGSPLVARLVAVWQEEGRIPIVGCGNPWHYDGLNDRADQ